MRRTVSVERASIGHANGLHAAIDPLYLRSSVALVVDQNTGDPLFQKNPNAVLPIASITKLMTAMVVLDAQLPLAEMLDISDDEVDLEKGTRSRLVVGTRLSRGELLNLALMSSENRAAHALGRHFPGGVAAFVRAMNAKAQAIGMASSRFNDPTGLSSRNVSTAHDLSLMVRAAYDYPLIREFSTATELIVDTGRRLQTYHSTNRLVDNPQWQIGLQKTGYISEAGSCLVMQATIEARPVVICCSTRRGGSRGSPTRSEFAAGWRPTPGGRRRERSPARSSVGGLLHAGRAGIAARSAFRARESSRVTLRRSRTGTVPQWKPSR
jgi:D-alanyl-D-alanine endopeptidase (penicillin-binding protein 7)